jgi:translation elongation factor EF-Ts
MNKFIIKLNCETDFVAKNEKFLDLSSQLAISVTNNANPSHKKVMFLTIIFTKNFINPCFCCVGG